MTAQGTAGLSRGSLFEGALGGMTMLQFVLLHLLAIDQEALLQEWSLLGFI